MGTAAERLVTDLPIWKECPFCAPKGIEIRRGKFDEDELEMIVLWAPRTQKHVDFQADHPVTESGFKAACEKLKRLIR